MSGLQVLDGSHSLPLGWQIGAQRRGGVPPPSPSQLVAEAVLVMLPYKCLTSDWLQAPNACHLSDFSWFMGVSHGLDHLAYLVEEHGYPVGWVGNLISLTQPVGGSGRGWGAVPGLLIMHGPGRPERAPVPHPDSILPLHCLHSAENSSAQAWGARPGPAWPRL